MGSASTTRSHKSTERTATVSSKDAARQRSHDGKKEPRTSKDGARLQLVKNSRENDNANFSRFLIMGESSSYLPESHRWFGTPGPPAPTIPGSAPECPSSG